MKPYTDLCQYLSYRNKLWPTSSKAVGLNLLAYIRHEILVSSRNETIKSQFLSVLTTLGIIAVFYYIAVFSYGTRPNHINNIAKYGYIVGNGDRCFRQLD